MDRDPLSSWVERVVRESQRLIEQANGRPAEEPRVTPRVLLPEALRRRLSWRPGPR